MDLKSNKVEPIDIADNGNSSQIPPQQVPPPYGQQPPYGGPAQAYAGPPQPYGGPPQPYGGPPQPYGAPPQPYGVSPPQQQQQQQQTNVVIVGGGQSAPVVRHAPGYGTAIAVSCLVLWFCGIVFGLIAYILAIMGRSRAEDQDEVTGRKFKIASYVVSAVGAVVGLTIIIVLCVTLTGTSYSYSSSCMPYGSCTYGRYLAYSNCYLCCSYSYSCFYGTNPLSGTCCTGN